MSPGQRRGMLRVIFVTMTTLRAMGFRALTYDSSNVSVVEIVGIGPTFEQISRLVFLVKGIFVSAITLDTRNLLAESFVGGNLKNQLCFSFSSSFIKVRLCTVESMDFI